MPPTDTNARTDRDGQKILAAYVDPTTHQAFKMLAVKEGTTNVALMHEAVALVLARHGEPLPAKAVKHLKDHHRPIPTVTGKPKGNSGPR